MIKNSNICKKDKSGGISGTFSGPLMKVGLLLMKHVL